MPLFVWALFVAFLRFCFLCGAAGVQGAACCVRPGCAVGSGPPARRPRCEPFARVGCCLWLRWCSGRRMARPPARLGNLTSFGAAPRSPPVPSGPSGALHTGGACCCVLPGQAPPPPTGTAAWPPHPRLGHTSAKKFALRASISVHTRKSSPSTAKTAQNQRFFACRANFFAVCSRIHSCWASFFALMSATATSQHPLTTPPETDNTNAGGTLPRDETTDTTARTKQPNSGHFPPAKVSRVSCTPRRATAKASPVSSDAESGLLVLGKVLRCSCLLPPSQSW